MFDRGGAVVAFYHLWLRTSDGRAVELVREAQSEQDIRRWAETQQLLVLSIRPVESSGSRPIRIVAEEADQLLQEISQARIAELPLPEALEAAAEATENAKLEAALRQIATACRSGDSPERAIRDVVLPERLRDMLSAAVAADCPPAVLAELLEALAWRRRLRRAVWSALFYPAFTAVAAVLIGCVVAMYIIKFSFWQELGLMNYGRQLSYLLGVTRPVVILTLVGSLVILRLGVKPSTYEWLLVSAPLFGEIYLGAILVPWLRVIGRLLSAGVPVERALDLAGRLAGSALAENGSRLVTAKMQSGVTLGSSLSEWYALPRSCTAFIRWGEAVGQVEEGILQAALYLTGRTQLAAQTVPYVATPVYLIVFTTIALQPFILAFGVIRVIS